MEISTVTDLYLQEDSELEPLGEVTRFGEQFMVVIPRVDQQYTPVCLHCSSGDDLNAILGFVTTSHYFQNYPPVILATSGPAGTEAFLQSKLGADFNDMLNAIISIDASYDSKAIMSMNNNIPPDIVDSIGPEWGVIKGGNPDAEKIACMYDIPCITMCYSMLNEHLIQTIPSCRGYRYSALPINDSEFAADDSTSNESCLLCGKRHRKLTYYYKLQGSLCDKCITRINKIGPVNLMTWARARYELKQERERTRRANLLQKFKPHPAAKCTCGGALVRDTRTGGADDYECTICHHQVHMLKQKGTYLKDGMIVDYIHNKLLATGCTDHVKACFSCGCATANPVIYKVDENDCEWYMCKACHSNLLLSMR